jgi:hypothetical protein
LILGVLAIQLLQWWHIPRRGWIIILTELAVIIGLGSWVYTEYLTNSYFQSYVNSLSPILVPIVSVGFGVASATIVTLLYFTMRNINKKKESKEEELSPRRGTTKRTVKKPQGSSSRSERAAAGVLATMPRSKLSTAGTSNARRGGARQSNDEDDQSE